MDERDTRWRRRIHSIRLEYTRTRSKLLSALLERDAPACALCGATDNLQIDHIHQIANGGTNDMRNLRLLCGKCNAERPKHLAKNRGCYICGDSAADRFYNRWFCQKHLTECNNLVSCSPKGTRRYDVLLGVLRRYSAQGCCEAETEAQP